MPLPKWFQKLLQKLPWKRSNATTENYEKSGLFKLHSPQADFDVDIVAVHGLSGDWKQTWTDDETQKLWLRDFLPTQYSNIRVWSFGYDASVLGKAASDIDTVATTLVDTLNGERASTRGRPIIFVAHSLGGIIVKRAVILANERSDHWGDIVDSTIGTMFFGVPHRGADAAYWANLAITVISIASLGIRGNRNFVEALRRNSREFSAISMAFIQPASKMKIIRSFYETVKIGNSVIVDKESASLYLNNELAVALEGTDHKNMCKFGSDESQKYQQVKLALSQMIPNATNINSDLDHRIRDFVQRTQSDLQTIPSETEAQDFRWMINMPHTRAWEASEGYKPLYVEYAAPLSWQTSLSRAFCEHLQSEDTGVIWGLAPIDDAQEVQSEAWKTQLPRRLLAQILHCYHWRSLPIQKVFALLCEAESTQTRLGTSWQDVFCSENASWEQQWMILFCALSCLDRNTFLIFVRFNDKLYEALGEGLKFLHLKYYGNRLRSDPSISLSIRHKALIIGTPRSATRPPEDTFTSVPASRINENEEMKACLKSLHFEPLHGRRDEVRKEAKNTTKWIREHRIYHDWRERGSSLLWVYGKAGSGKSTLAASLQRSLCKDAHNIVMVDFFYNISGKPVQNGHLWMLRSILYQILKKKEALYQFYKPCFRKVMANSHESWKYDFLKDILLRLRDGTTDGDRLNFLFIIDGFDESEDGEDPGTSREHLADLLSELCNSKAGNIFQVIVLSRSEPPIKSILKPAYFINMKDENHHDIERIIRYGIFIINKRLNSGHDKSLMVYNSASTNVEDFPDIPELEPIKDHLLKHADGVILWVILVLREMESIVDAGVDSVWQLKINLDKFPADLVRTYEGMLERLKARKSWKPQQSSYIFSWLLFSGDTMTLCEMREVIAMFGWCDYSDDIRRNFLNEHSILQQEDPWSPTWKQLSHICGGFIEIIPDGRYAVEASQRNGALDSDDSVQLIHRTAREFLLNCSESEIPSLNDTHSADPFLTACVDYMELLFSVDHSSPIESWNDLCLYLQERPLLGYILEYLPTKLAVHAYKQNPTAIHSYKRIIEYAAKAWQTQLYPAIWFFMRWEERVYLNSYGSFIYQVQDGSSSKFNELLCSIGSDWKSCDEIPPDFSATLRGMGRFGFNDTIHLRELREMVPEARTEDIHVKPGYLLAYEVDEGAKCAVKFGYPEAFKIFLIVAWDRKPLPSWMRDSIDSKNPKILRLWMGGENEYRLISELPDAILHRTQRVELISILRNMERSWDTDISRNLRESKKTLVDRLDKERNQRSSLLFQEYLSRCTVGLTR